MSWSVEEGGGCGKSIRLSVTVSDGAFMMSVTVSDGAFMMSVTVSDDRFMMSVTSVTAGC
jgi:hypothetical protein